MNDYWYDLNEATYEGIRHLETDIVQYIKSPIIQRISQNYSSLMVQICFYVKLKH
jgi:hypothetical protein